MASGTMVICDPEKVEEFASALREFNASVAEANQHIRSVADGARTVWNDVQYRSFREEFDRDMRAVEQFLDASRRMVPRLQRKASVIRRYLNHR